MRAGHCKTSPEEESTLDVGIKKQLSIRDFPAGITVTCITKVVMTYDDSEAFTAGRDYVIASNHAGADPAHVRMINNQGKAHRMGLDHLCRHFQQSQVVQTSPSEADGTGNTASETSTRSAARVHLASNQPDVSMNVELIQAYAQGKEISVSSSQLLMIGLALCRPKLLEDARFPTLDARSAWNELEDAQQKAIFNWWNARQ